MCSQSWEQLKCESENSHCWSKAEFILSLRLTRRNQTNIYFFPNLPRAVAATEPQTAMILFLISVGKTKDELLRRGSWQLLLLNASYTNLDVLPFQAHLLSGSLLSDSCSKIFSGPQFFSGKMQTLHPGIPGPSWSGPQHLFTLWVEDFGCRVAVLFP